MASGNSGVEQARERDAAVADALDEAARVLVRLAARLRAVHDGPRAADRAAAPPPAVSAPEKPDRRRRRQPLGERQQAVLALGGLGTETGLAAGDVAQALGYTAPNATNILKRLEELSYLSRVPGERPLRWRRREVAG